MRIRCVVPVLVMASALAVSSPLRAETAAESFAQGEALVAKGDFAAALQSFAAAARADLDNQQYMQHYAMLRRVVQLRSQLDTEQDPQRWEQAARALRAFYLNERVLSELLKIEQAIHARLGTADSAAMLAETLLTTGGNAEALDTLSSLDPGKATVTTRALLGIALARSGKADDARQIARELELPADAGPRMTYAAARLHAAVGDSATAVALLKRCFEGTMPSLLEGFKAHAKACSEFTAMAASPEFVAVLATESKMPESKCSGGRSCAGCPMSGKCPHSQAKAE